MIGGKRGVRSRHIGSHPEGRARYDTVQKHTREYTLQRRVAPGPSFRMGTTVSNPEILFPTDHPRPSSTLTED